MLSLVVGVTLTWALVAKAIPDLDPDGDRVARIREPIGYWNALALLADVALALGLWLGTAPTHRRTVRVAGGLLLYVSTLALLLTLSRAGVVVGVGVLALWLVLSSERVEGGLLLVAASDPRARRRGVGVHAARPHGGCRDAFGSGCRRDRLRHSGARRRRRRRGARRLGGGEVAGA